MERKKAAFAGSWYPGTAQACEAAIQKFVADHPENQEKGLPRAADEVLYGGIVPHAGWIYSGNIACRIIRVLAGPAAAEPIDTIILFGMHMHPDARPQILARGAVETPLGDIESDAELADAVTALGRVQALGPDSFPQENTLELQYPFIRYFFPKARLLACGVPPSQSAVQVAEAVVRAVEGLGLRVKVIGSTDMTHYGPNFGFSPAGSGAAAVDWVEKENDPGAIQALVRMDSAEAIAQGLGRRNMCCAGAAAAAAHVSKKNGRSPWYLPGLRHKLGHLQIRQFCGILRDGLCRLRAMEWPLWPLVSLPEFYPV